MRGILNATGSAQASVGGKLTLDAFQRAVDAIENQPVHPCRLGQHVIAASARPGSITLCGNCGLPVEVPW